MPKELKVRQRGKKKSKAQKQEQEDQHQASASHQEPSFQDENAAGPSWSRPATEREQNETGEEETWVPSAPFGLVDPDLKAYLREAFTQLKQFSSNTSTNPDDPDHDQNNFEFEDEDGDGSQHSLLMKATLKELDGKELQLATDGEGSMLLEYLAKRLDGKSLRILFDRLAGNYSTVASHRFGSHVLQSSLSSLQRLISSETRTARKRMDESAGDITTVDSNGVLRSATSLVRDMCVELSPDLPNLFQDQFGTHVIRSLLLLLSSNPVTPPPLNSGNATASLRSKKSSKFRKGQDPSEEINSSQAATPKAYLVPSEFKQTLEKLRENSLREVGTNEIRALAVNPISSPTLQLFLTLENQAASSSSNARAQNLSATLRLSDLVLGGLISNQESDEELPSSKERLDHLETLLRDPVGTHVLETLLKSTPKSVHSDFYRLYLKGRVVKLGIHPVANFVVAAGLRRLGSESKEEETASSKEEDQDLMEAITEIKSAGDKLVKEGKIGILQALTMRCGHIGKFEVEIVEAIKSAFRMDKDEGEVEGKPEEKDANGSVDLLVPIILSMRTKKAYIRTRGKAGEKKRKGRKVEKKKEAEDEEMNVKEEDGNQEGEKEDEMEATVQGSLLLQTMVRLSALANDAVFKSLLSQPSLLPLSKSSIAVHVLLVALSTSSSTFQQRRLLIGSLIPSLLELADDKWGSRVCDSLWQRSDGFTKHKITRSLTKSERQLAASWYGRFFARKINFGLFRRDEGSWRESFKNAKVEIEEVKSLKDEWDSEVKEQEAQIEKADEGAEGGKRKRDEEQSSKSKRSSKKQKKVKTKEEGELDKILSAF